MDKGVKSRRALALALTIQVSAGSDSGIPRVSDVPFSYFLVVLNLLSVLLRLLNQELGREVLRVIFRGRGEKDPLVPRCGVRGTERQGFQNRFPALFDTIKRF